MARHLERGDFKRLMRSRYWLRGHFLVMLLCTALVTLSASHVLLALGLQNIMVRYLICLLFSYLAFLLLLRIWLGFYIFPNAPKGSSDAGNDSLNLVTELGDWADHSPGWKGQGGGYSGAGASDDWGAPKMPKVDIPSSWGDLDGDAPVVIPLIVVVALAALALFLISAVGIAVYTAPAILCEIALEMAVTIGIVRLTIKEKDLTKGSWLRAALRRTALPFILLLLAVMVGLGILVHYYPEVTKLSDIWYILR